jgi:hypothetical protein
VSPQEFAGLLRAGWITAALAVGACVGEPGSPFPAPSQTA